MSDDRDDEILDLTEEMQAESDADAPPEPEAEAGEGGQGDEDSPDSEDENNGEDSPESDADSDSDSEPRTSGPPPKSPFTLLAEPRTEEQIRESRVSVTPPEERGEESRPSFVPRKSDAAVVTAQVVRLGEGGPAVAEEFRKADEKAKADEAEKAEAEEAEPEETKAEEPEAAAAEEAEPAEEEPAEEEPVEEEPAEDEEILDLGQEYVVADEVTDDDVGTEPIPLVTESMPPREPTAEDGEGEGGSTESASAEATAGSSSSGADELNPLWASSLALTAAGGAAMVAGIVLLIVDDPCIEDTEAHGCKERFDSSAAGIPLAGLGGIAVGVGIAGLVLLDRRTGGGDEGGDDEAPAPAAAVLSVPGGAAAGLSLAF